MSTDATAIVFFGFPIPSLRVAEGALNDEWEAEYRPTQPKDRSDYTTPEWDAWRTQVKAWRNTPQNVEISFCGGEDTEKFFVHCPCFQRRVALDLKPLDLRQDTADAQQWLDAFCDRFNLPKRTAGWYLGARYF